MPGVRQQGVGFTGVYRVRNGAIGLVRSQLERPNGLWLSRPMGMCCGWPTQSRTRPLGTPSWHAFELRDQLPLERTAVLGEAELGVGVQLGPALSDGLKLDEQGRIWGSTPGGLVVIDPAAKAVVASVEFATNVSNDGDGPDVFCHRAGPCVAPQAQRVSSLVRARSS